MNKTVHQLALSIITFFSILFVFGYYGLDAFVKHQNADKLWPIEYAQQLLLNPSHFNWKFGGAFFWFPDLFSMTALYALTRNVTLTYSIYGVLFFAAIGLLFYLILNIEKKSLNKRHYITAYLFLTVFLLFVLHRNKLNWLVLESAILPVIHSGNAINGLLALFCYLKWRNLGCRSKTWAFFLCTAVSLGIFSDALFIVVAISMAITEFLTRVVEVKRKNLEILYPFLYLCTPLLYFALFLCYFKLGYVILEKTFVTINGKFHFIFDVNRTLRITHDILHSLSDNIFLSILYFLTFAFLIMQTGAILKYSKNKSIASTDLLILFTTFTIAINYLVLVFSESYSDIFSLRYFVPAYWAMWLFLCGLLVRTKKLHFPCLIFLVYLLLPQMGTELDQIDQVFTSPHIDSMVCVEKLATKNQIVDGFANYWAARKYRIYNHTGLNMHTVDNGHYSTHLINLESLPRDKNYSDFLVISNRMNARDLRHFGLPDAMYECIDEHVLIFHKRSHITFN